MTTRFVEVDYILAEARNCFSDMGDYAWLERILCRQDAPSIEQHDPCADCQEWSCDGCRIRDERSRR